MTSVSRAYSTVVVPWVLESPCSVGHCLGVPETQHRAHFRSRPHRLLREGKGTAPRRVGADLGLLCVTTFNLGFRAQAL